MRRRRTEMAGSLQVRLLGQLRLTVDGRPVDGPATARLQSLFAYLLLHSDAPQPRAQVSFLFWPDASEANARNSLRQLLHQLRQSLPEPDRYLRTDAQSVQWAPDASFSFDVALIDAALAEAEGAGRAGDATRRRACLERAVGLCQGPLLPGCYDDWIGAERERLARRCEQAVAALVGMLEEQREYASAIAHVRHWLQHDPVDEEAYRWLMRLLALAGDRAAALQAYRQCADALRRELAAEPSAPTLRTYERIRDADPGPSAPSPGGHEGTPAALSLVGRRGEWARLREAWERTAHGGVFFALVTGDAGIGKSRLAEELLTWAQRQGVAAAKTRSYAAEGRLSLAPVSEWLRSEALSPHLARLEDVWRVEVARILPELLGDQPDLPRPAPMTEFGDRLRFFEGLARAVLLVPPPLLLLIDDLQWCDRETIEWLHFLSRFAREARLLVLGTARTDELDDAHDLAALLRHLRSTSQLAEIALEPLDAAETAALAAQVGSRAFDTDAATRLYRETEGYPLFVVETVRGESGGDPAPGVPEQVISGLPPRAHAVIAGRLAGLSEQARKLAATAAVIGRAFDLDVLVRLVGDEEVVVRALDELWRKRIVREQGPNAYDFTHDRLREVAYGATSAPQRRLLHRRVAEALVAANEKGLDPVSAQIAAHYESAGLLEQAIPHYARAAVVAQGIYAHDEAIALAGRALSLLGPLPSSARRDGWELDLQLILAPSYRVTKGWAAPELGAGLDRALALCDCVGTTAQRAQILTGMQSRYIVEGRLERCALITDELVRVFREAREEPPGSVFAMLAGVRLQMGRFQGASDDIDRLVREADPSHFRHLQESQGLNYEVIVRAWQSHGLWCLGRPDTAFEISSRTVHLARKLGQPFSQVIAATYLALLQQLRADPATFRRQAEEALGLATEFKATYYWAWASILVAYADTLDSPEADAAARLRAAIESFKETGARLRLPYYLALLADAHLRAEEADAGLGVVEEALSRSRETNERWWDAELHRLRAELLLAGGAAAIEAEAALGQALEIARGQQARSLELRAASALARLWAGSGRTAEARDLLSPLYSSFTEGLETPDLAGARALLSRLG